MVALVKPVSCLFSNFEVKMKKLILALCLFSGVAFAQQQVRTIPAPLSATVAGGTVATTNTFQSVFAAPVGVPGQNTPLRQGCMVRLVRGNGPLFVFLGAIASATTATSISLNSPSSISLNCADFSPIGIPQDQISVTGTSGDGFMAIQQ